MDKDTAIIILTAHLELPLLVNSKPLGTRPDLSGTKVREAIYFALQEMKKENVPEENKEENKEAKKPVFQPPITFPVVK